ncbi:MAG TPA: KpsF/GutQ family sugar-phosphate isomerase [bacterium]|nr:KpsF/GutQ family sugar-phosphate isomerase [bacterium]HPQ67098.1 KpsF/GutQ family sugar-phosphate isomerase [bacterium]
MNGKPVNIPELAREVIEIEAEALSVLGRRLDKEFERAVEICSACRGRIVVTGMGKAGLVARKISATLASVGSPSIWLHPAEALHGDLGIIGEADVVLAVSNSGESDEIKALLPYIDALSAPLVAITGNPKSTLAKAAKAVLDASVAREACPDNLVPTASTTAAMALGDALAVCLKELRGFKASDFARLHPGGTLGKRLLAKVGDLMRKGAANPVVGEEATVKEVLFRITAARAGAASVTGADGVLTGIFTDGDLRRWLERDPGIMERRVGEVMTGNPLKVREDQKALEAMEMIRDRKIDEVPVVDSRGAPVGMLDVQDLLSAGII